MMKVLSTLYKSKDLFQRLVDAKNINNKDTCLVRIYTAIYTESEAVAIAQEIVL